MLGELSGRPLRVVVRASLGPHLAATSIPRRLIQLDRDVLRKRGDFERILIHELFHFAWVRLSNAKRRDWEKVLERELKTGARGELGWSAEWRKAKLNARDPHRRTPRWRRYVCESFCDTAAYLHAGLSRHEEFTLPARDRAIRKSWFRTAFPATAAIPI